MPMEAWPLVLDGKTFPRIGFVHNAALAKMNSILM